LEKAILAGPCVGEMYWELGRFATHVIWLKRKKYPDAKLIVITREDRFDMYGKYADILVPLRIPDNGKKQVSDCFRLLGFDYIHVKEIAKQFHKKYAKRFEIITHVYPNLEKKNWSNKNLYNNSQMVFNKFLPRNDNKTIIDKMIPKDKPLVIIAPRFRSGLRRNWKHWPELYDLIEKSGLMKNYNFVLCGKIPDHIPDQRGRFYDINNFPGTENTSLIGFTLECMNRACLTVGSQSGIPNISLLYGVEVLEWGHQKSLHTKTYNPFKTPITFIDNPGYDISPKEVLNKITNILSKKGN